jgi:two-component system chemotaxis response regulator CheY
VKGKLKILIAEDSNHVRMGLKDILHWHGCEVVGEAESGAKALELFKKLSPDITIVDITMPKMSGIDVLKAIRAEDPKATVIMLAAMNEQNKVIDAMRFGAYDFFIKPVQSERVLEAIEELRG